MEAWVASCGRELHLLPISTEKTVLFREVRKLNNDDSNFSKACGISLMSNMSSFITQNLLFTLSEIYSKHNIYLTFIKVSLRKIYNSSR